MIFILFLNDFYVNNHAGFLCFICLFFLAIGSCSIVNLYEHICGFILSMILILDHFFSVTGFNIYLASDSD